jgi:hypothetical protein
MLKNKKIKKKEENSNFTKIGTTPKWISRWTLTIPS